MSDLCAAFDDWTQGVAAIVFLDPASTADQIAVIEAALMADDAIEYLFIDKATAFEEFQAMFRDSDQIRSSLAIEDMPASFRLRMTDESLLDQDSPLIEDLRDDPAVMEITFSSDQMREPFADC